MADDLRTLAELPFHVSGRYPKEVLIRRCQADAADVTELSARDFFERVRDLGLGLGALGVESGDRVAILSESRPEWLIADFAALTGGAVTVPIYPTLPEAQVRYILADSGARAAVAADETQAAKVRAVWGDLPALEALIVVDAPPAGPPPAAAPAAAAPADTGATAPADAAPADSGTAAPAGAAPAGGTSAAAAPAPAAVPAAAPAAAPLPPPLRPPLPPPPFPPPLRPPLPPPPLPPPPRRPQAPGAGS